MGNPFVVTGFRFSRRWRSHESIPQMEENPLNTSSDANDDLSRPCQRQFAGRMNFSYNRSGVNDSTPTSEWNAAPLIYIRHETGLQGMG
jgi:hypothetical protein